MSSEENTVQVQQLNIREVLFCAQLLDCTDQSYASFNNANGAPHFCSVVHFTKSAHKTLFLARLKYSGFNFDQLYVTMIRGYRVEATRIKLKPVLLQV